MKEIVSRCGFRCDMCVAFLGTGATAEEREKAAAGWKKYFHLDFKLDDMHCNGCLSNECNGHALPDKNCEIRKCVVEREMSSCADCIEYPCEKMDERMESVENVIAKFAGRVPKAEFDKFLAPYEARKTLNELRDRRVDRID